MKRKGAGGSTINLRVAAGVRAGNAVVQGGGSGQFLGVASDHGDAGDTIAVHVGGIYEFSVAAAEDIESGDRAFVTSHNASVATGTSRNNFRIGNFLDDVAVGDEGPVRVMLLWGGS